MAKHTKRPSRSVNGLQAPKPSGAVREMIGRTYSPQTSYNRYWSLYTVDYHRSDYRFWDKFRRCEVLGHRLSGNFGQAIPRITSSWVMAGGLAAKLNSNVLAHPSRIEHTDALLASFMDAMQGILLNFLTNEYALGDMYFVVSPDGKISVPSPDTVEPEFDATDFRKLIRVTIRTRTNKAHIEDIYTAECRTVKIQLFPTPPGEPPERVIVYDNLIGRIPIIHFPCDRGTNEVFGRPLCAPLLYLFERYDDLLTKALDGAELMGNPVPAFTGLKNVQETMLAMTQPVGDVDNDTYPLDYNVPIGERRIAWDTLPGAFVGEGGDFKFVAPGVGFTTDIREMLKVLFLLILDHSRLPEVVWGNAMQGENATAKEQMLTFYMFIEGMRLELEGRGATSGFAVETEGGLHALLDIWLRTKRLTDPDIVVAPVVFRWGELSTMDKQMQLQWTQWLHDKGLLTDVEAVAQSELVEDAQAEVDAAKEQNAPVVLPTTPASAAPQPAAEIQEATGQPFYVALSLSNNSELIDLQTRVKKRMQGSEVQWSTPSDFHLTLVYAPVVTDVQSEQIKTALQTLPPPDLTLGIGSLKTFDNLGEYAVHFRVKRNAALLDYQQKLTQVFEQAGVQISQFSQPVKFTPHITMGYAVQKPASIIFDGQMTVSPSGLIAEYGDEPVEVGGVPQSIEEMKGLSRVVREAIQTTRLEYEAQVESILAEAISGRLDRRRFSLLMRNALGVASRKAFLDGLKEGGIEETELESDDIEWLNNHIAEQSQYVTAIGDAIYRDGRVDHSEVDGRSIMWWNKSVQPAFYRGLASASKNALYEWTLGNAEHCSSCQLLSGQRRRMSFWQRTVLPKSDELACGGFLCKCQLISTKAQASKGRLPRWQLAETHEHDHLEVVTA